MMTRKGTDMHGKTRKRPEACGQLLCLLFCAMASMFLFPLSSFPQEADSTELNVTHATMFYGGVSSQQDTYLTPLRYTGYQLSMLHEGLRMTSLWQGRVSGQSLVQLNFTSSSSDSGKGSYLGGQVHYDYALHYNWLLGERWRLMVGPQLGGTLGVLYNARNSNNPAQAIANVHLNASAAAIFRFPFCRREAAVRYQTDFQLLGVMFSPNYGQSYYEIFVLQQPDHNVIATLPWKALRWRNQLTMDIPLRRSSIRYGLFLDSQSSHVNNLVHADFTAGFMVGWVRHHTRRLTRRQFHNDFIL